LGYPDAAAERALLMGDDRRTMLQHLPQFMQADELIEAQHAIKKIHCSEALLDYLQKLLLETRRSGMFTAGLSPRAGIALLQAARAWAALEGRDHVIPEDVQAVFVSVAAHRLHPLASNSGNSLSSQVLLDKLIKQVAL
jgi:MoxR-like ATPase